MQITVPLLIATLAVAHASVTVKRSSNDGPHPSAMEIEVQLPSNKRVLIPLSRNDAFEDVPMTVTENGISRTFSSRQLHSENHSHYGDIESMSVVSVRNVKGKRTFTGHVMHEGASYFLKPMGDSEHMVTRNLRNPEFMEKRISATKLKIQSRKKRQTVRASTTNTVELHLLIDSTVYSMFESIYGSSSALTELYYYYTHILNGMDTAYRSIKKLSISVSCIGITISKTAYDDAWMPRGNTQGSSILHRMKTYINDSTVDHFMAFTRIDIASKRNKRTVGMSFLNGVCTKAKVSIIEDQGLHSWGVAAHELGHNLGSLHDGDGNTCSSRDQNIMARDAVFLTMSNVGNSYRFSRCSVSYISRYIRSLGFSNCLRSSQGSRKSNVASDVREGARITLDQVCRLAYPNSIGKFYIGKSVLSNPASVCTIIHCKLSSTKAEWSESFYTSTLVGLRAPVGTPCGNKKSCNWRGRCTKDNSAPAADESCFWGDTWPAKICRNWKVVLRRKRRLCYQYYSVRRGCCKTLARLC